MPNLNQEYDPPSNTMASIVGCMLILMATFVVYGTTLSEKRYIQSLKYSTWNEITISFEQNFNITVFEYQAQKFHLHINQDGKEIYNQSCRGFNVICKELKNNKFKIVNMSFYSNDSTLDTSTYLMIKSIDYLNATKEKQTIKITKLTPNNPKYIAKQKATSIVFLFLKFFIFSLFTLIFYFNHPGRFFTSPKKVQQINNCIMYYYAGTFIFIIFTALQILFI